MKVDFGKLVFQSLQKCEGVKEVKDEHFACNFHAYGYWTPDGNLIPLTHWLETFVRKTDQGIIFETTEGRRLLAKLDLKDRLWVNEQPEVPDPNQWRDFGPLSSLPDPPKPSLPAIDYGNWRADRRAGQTVKPYRLGR